MGSIDALPIALTKAEGRRATPSWPQPPASEAYLGLAGDFVRAVEADTEASHVALLAQFLTLYGSAIGRNVHFRANADRHGANLFCALVGRTAKSRKGTSYGLAQAFVLSAAPDWAARIVSGLSSGEGLIAQVQDPVEKVVKGVLETVEAGVMDKRLLVCEPEYARVLRVIARDGNTLSPLMRQAWDSGDLASLTKKASRATGAHISIIGHVTEDELRRYLTTTEMSNGWGNRHLWICVERSQLLPEGGRFRIEEHAGLTRKLEAAIEHGRATDEMRRDDRARVLWREVYATLSEGKPGLSGAMVARAEAQVMRLAMIYALLDLKKTIGVDHLEAGLALWHYAERSVHHLFGDSLGDPLADELLRALRANPLGMTRTEIRNYFNKNKRKPELDRAFDLLLQYGRARVERNKTRGRPEEVWFAI